MEAKEEETENRHKEAAKLKEDEAKEWEGKPTAELKEEKPEKWKGKATAKLSGISSEQVWPLLEDFCSFHLWLPTIDTCHHVEGLKGQPGLVRYCASKTTTSSSGSSASRTSSLLDESNKMIKWCHEKLIAIDPVEHCMSYEVLELEKGCEIEWSFLSDPAEGLTCEDLQCYLSLALNHMAEIMEKAIQASLIA